MKLPFPKSDELTTDFFWQLIKGECCSLTAQTFQTGNMCHPQFQVIGTWQRKKTSSTENTAS
jgi:hypothetical protein